MTFSCYPLRIFQALHVEKRCTLLLLLLLFRLRTTYIQYINRVRANIHIVLCMSPLGEAFRTRLRMFPSIVNCCTIDWFMEWPDEV